MICTSYYCYLTTFFSNFSDLDVVGEILLRKVTFNTIFLPIWHVPIPLRKIQNNWKTLNPNKDRQLVSLYTVARVSGMKINQPV